MEGGSVALKIGKNVSSKPRTSSYLGILSQLGPVSANFENELESLSVIFPTLTARVQIKIWGCFPHQIHLASFELNEPNGGAFVRLSKYY
jgi:hypothetical protein